MKVEGVRRRARELAFKVLFEAEQGNVALAQAWLNACNNLQTAEPNILIDDDPVLGNSILDNSVLAKRGLSSDNIEETITDQNLDEDEAAEVAAMDGEAMAFAHRLVLGFDEQHEVINETLNNVIEGWSFNQMSKTDLNVLRVAGYELMYLDTPPLAVIEVAVRMAKKYGGEESGKFVNGVLAKLKVHVESGAHKGKR